MGERSGEKNGLLDWLRSLRLPSAARGVAAAALAPKILPAVLGPQRDLGSEELGPYLGGGGDARVRVMVNVLAADEDNAVVAPVNAQDTLVSGQRLVKP